MVKLRSGLTNIFLGLSLALTLPPVSQLWAGVAGLSILVFLESRLQHRGAFWRGLAFGFGYFAFAFHWIGFAFLVDATSYLWMMPFAVGGLALFMAIYWGVAFVAARQLERLRLPLCAGLPVSLAVVEWLRGYLFTGFPWAAPGLALAWSDALLQLASLVGMPGLTLLVLLWGMVPGAALVRMHRHGRRGLTVLTLLLMVPVGWLWGNNRLSGSTASHDDGTLVRLVQPNIAQSDKWRGDNARAIFDDLLRLTLQETGIRPDVIIWPESSVPFLLDESVEALRLIGDGLEEGQTLLAGSIRRDVASADCVGCPDRYFTSILVIDDTGKVMGRYDKWRLVPGGEYLPLSWLLEPLGFRKVVSLPESFDAGPGPSALDVPGLGRAAMLVCYEAIFPHRLLPDDRRPDIIVNVTNDGWFGQSVGPYQHFAQVRLRAVEQGLPVLRAANTGISAFVDSFGRIGPATTLGVQEIIESRIPQLVMPTPYSKAGDFTLLGLILVIFTISGIFAQFIGKQSLGK